MPTRVNALTRLMSVGPRAVSTARRISRAVTLSQRHIVRLSDARAKVVKEVQRVLADRLKIARDEVPDVARLIQSQLDISISRLLGSAKG